MKKDTKIQPQHIFRNLIRLLLENWHLLLYTVVAAVLSTVFAIFGPKYLGQATNIIVDCFTANEGVMDYDQLGTVLLTALGLYVLSAVWRVLFAYRRHVGTHHSRTFRAPRWQHYRPRRSPLFYLPPVT